MKKLFVSLTLFMFVLSCFSQQTIELNYWKFKTGDSLDWAQPGYNNSGWKPIEAGKVWEWQGYKDYDGYAWYCIKFNLPSELKKNALFKDSILFMLGNIDDCDQTFLNGKLLGQNAQLVPSGNITPLQDLSKLERKWDITRNYTLPVNDPRLAWDKENTLAIRVFDGGSNGGISSLPVHIRMKGLKDYVVFETDSKLLEISQKGMAHKTITLKNFSPQPELRGALKLEVTNGDGTKNIFAQTYNDVELKKSGNTFTFRFKGDPFLRMKATYTFTESKTKNKTAYTQEPECSGNWAKYENSPVLGGNLGTMFDVCVLKNDAGVYVMYCSWRNKKSIALSESKDGLTWSDPVICFGFNNNSGWEEDVNRPTIVQKDGIYHMWYTGQTGAATVGGHSWIGYAVSNDGKNWIRKSNKPVLSPELTWENVAVMSPHVIWDEQEQIFKMWYCGGEQIEPNAIGYATSKDGIHWVKYRNNPVFTSDKQNYWEQDRVAGCMVIKRPNDYVMFYIGYVNMGYAQIGMARSKDGITHWERFKENPIIAPGLGWDFNATYKPYPVPDPVNNRWLLYYNGCRGDHEQIGIAIHKGMDLGF